MRRRRRFGVGGEELFPLYTWHRGPHRLHRKHLGNSRSAVGCGKRKLEMGPSKQHLGKEDARWGTTIV
ncbi:hypothetical protein I7I53_05451 [Histoplasma capsulatum var. duboisii H88]|uniref:Uncharacterized protein n=1 Tax=Ajellomyces capsulatus (strain H88) TaxID=544711 RepID=A0A8A1LSZ7_AJEC8|nr:hypothetical protein I7I53_05451 [Histoplasma capsulatum var. duboisii H88]